MEKSAKQRNLLSRKASTWSRDRAVRGVDVPFMTDGNLWMCPAGFRRLRHGEQRN